MQIGKECIQYLLVNTMLKHIYIYNNIYIYEKTPFHVSSLGNMLNKFQFEIVQCTMA
jgi:hypothetical protein